jgi:anti-anti-sigma factor
VAAAAGGPRPPGARAGAHLRPGDEVDVRRTDEGGGDATGTTVRFRLPPPADPDGPVVRAPRSVGGEDDGPPRVDVREGGNGRWLVVSGAVDLSSAGSLGAELRARLATVPGGAVVTIDLTRVTYLASAGVGLLLELSGALRERGIGVRLVTDPGSVPARVLALTGVDAGAPSA